MKKLFKLMALASAVFLLGACAEETVLTPQQAKDASPENNAIAFGTYMGRTGQTRAGATGNITTDVLKKADYGFGVFAYYTGTATYNGWQNPYAAADANHVANFMYNQQVYWDESNAQSPLVTKWYYTPLKYWPNEVTNAYTWRLFGPSYNNGAMTTAPTTSTAGTLNQIYYNTTTHEYYWLSAIEGSTYTWITLSLPSTTSSAPSSTTEGNRGDIIKVDDTQYFLLIGVPDVDDQNNDKNNDPAIAVGNYGGNVSFFAYAPYVDISTPSDGKAESYSSDPFAGAAVNETVSGILGFTTNAENKDPMVAYKIPVASNESVDLLWGTKGNTNANVNETGNVGETYNASGNNYEKEILPKYTLNADLTKQKTTGTIDFAFKHATSKVGGSYDASDDGDDEDPSTPTGGLMIVLDLDKNGNETGGVLEDWPVSGELTNKLKYKTKVTVKNIEIESYEQAKESSPVTIVDGVITNINYEEDWTDELKNQGVFNLATGKWSKQIHTTDFTGIKHTIVSPASSDDEKNARSAELSDEIAEIAFSGTDNLENRKSHYKTTLPIGVTTVVKNVYKDEASPLLFLPDIYPVLHVTVEYIVRTYDANLKNGYSEVAQKIKKRLVFTKKTELNKQYNLLIHLGLTGVKFTAYVSNWDNDGMTTTTTTDPSTGDVITLYQTDEEVWNPINVEGTVTNLTAGLKTAMDVEYVGDKNGTKKKFNASAGAKNFTISSLGTGANGINQTIDLAVKATIKKKEKGTTDDYDVEANAGYEVVYDDPMNTGWLTVSHDGKISIAENTNIATGTAADRSAKINVTYGEKTDEITVKQLGRKVKTLDLTVNSKTNAAWTTDNGAAINWDYTVVANVTDSDGEVLVENNKDVTADAAITIKVGGKENVWIANKSTKKITGPANTTGSDKTGTIDVKYYGQVATTPAGTMTITQVKSPIQAVGVATVGSVLKVEYTAPGQSAATLTAGTDKKVTVNAIGGTLKINTLTANFSSESSAIDYTENATSKAKFTNVTESWLRISTDGKTITVDPNTTKHSADEEATVTLKFKDATNVEQTLTFIVVRKKLSTLTLSLTVKGTAVTTNYETGYSAKNLPMELKCKYSDGTTTHDFTETISSSHIVKDGSSDAWLSVSGGVLKISEMPVPRSADRTSGDKVKATYTVDGLSATPIEATVTQKYNVE